MCPADRGIRHGPSYCQSIPPATSWTLYFTHIVRHGRGSLGVVIRIGAPSVEFWLGPLIQPLGVVLRHSTFGPQCASAAVMATGVG